MNDINMNDKEMLEQLKLACDNGWERCKIQYYPEFDDVPIEIRNLLEANYKHAFKEGTAFIAMYVASIMLQESLKSMLKTKINKIDKVENN